MRERKTNLSMVVEVHDGEGEDVGQRRNEDILRLRGKLVSVCGFDGILEGLETDLAPLRVVGARLGLGPRNLLLASDRDADVRVGRTTSQLGALDASSAVELDLQDSDGRVWAGENKREEASAGAWRQAEERNGPRGAPLSKDSRFRVKTLGSYIMGLK